MLVKKKKKKTHKELGLHRSVKNLQLLECSIVFSLLIGIVYIQCLTFSVISHVEMSLEVTVGFNGAFLWMHE